MNPAFSVIFFTTASGAGYGMLALLGLLAPARMLPQTAMFGVVATVLALALVTAGLLSSLRHLGHPERARLALSQWRSSWLSREGVAAIVTYIPAVLFPAAWIIAGPNAPATAILGLLSALAAAATVYCTGMIYVSLKPIRQWSTPLVTRNYLLYAGFSGALCLAMLTALFGANPATPAILALLLGFTALFSKLRYWLFIDIAKPTSTIETATGLGGLGKVRMLESPNTQDNYLLKEMGFRIGRKHATKLRRIAILSGFVAPGLLLGLALFAGGVVGAVLTVFATTLAGIGLIAERWLFFAQATHTVTLYYGRPA